ncbi:hypothetical protein G4O51_03210 [Candidatus Bathyarchaeota archaeon A05DMB-2]|jgi:hypothetical protein|nr:hypothetical protein [Candidatus Bathyarchaeota archaeon A05DMB-2]
MVIAGDVLEADEAMVRFQRRWSSKSYKGKRRRYPIYSVNFPTELNGKVEAKRQKDYDLTWTEKETDKQEIITLTFTRNKQQSP